MSCYLSEGSLHVCYSNRHSHGIHTEVLQALSCARDDAARLGGPKATMQHYLPGEWMSKAMVGTLDVLVLCLDFTVYSKDYKARKQLFLVQLNNLH